MSPLPSSPPLLLFDGSVPVAVIEAAARMAIDEDLASATSPAGCWGYRPRGHGCRRVPGTGVVCGLPLAAAALHAVTRRQTWYRAAVTVPWSVAWKPSWSQGEARLDPLAERVMLNFVQRLRDCHDGA